MSGEPVRKAVVELVTPQGRLVAYTDPAGRFAFGGLPAGSYQFRVNRAGFWSATFDVPWC